MATEKYNNSTRLDLEHALKVEPRLQARFGESHSGGRCIRAETLAQRLLSTPTVRLTWPEASSCLQNSCEITAGLPVLYKTSLRGFQLRIITRRCRRLRVMRCRLIDVVTTTKIESEEYFTLSTRTRSTAIAVRSNLDLASWPSRTRNRQSRRATICWSRRGDRGSKRCLISLPVIGLAAAQSYCMSFFEPLGTLNSG